MTSFIVYVARLFIFLISLSHPFLTADSKQTGFAIDLIHRDSLLSPSYNPKKTLSQRWLDALQQSYDRANFFNHQFTTPTNDYYSDVVYGGLIYFMKLQIGDPSVNMLVSIDTGSDLSWVQCEPCDENQCTPLNYPRFNREQSHSYVQMRHDDPNCDAIESTETDGQWCYYSRGYLEQSFSEGELAYETINLEAVDGEQFAFRHIIIGCSTKNIGLFNPQEGGVVGLGNWPTSLIGQLRRHTDGFFSHCFLPNGEERQGILYFGPNGNMRDAVATRYYSKTYLGTTQNLYFLNLRAIIVDNEWYEFEYTFGESDGNILLDTGTTFIMLPVEYHHMIMNAIARYIDISAEQVYQPNAINTICYRNLLDAQVPPVTFVFEGASVVLGRDQLFKVYNFDTYCLAIGISEVVPFYGNIALQYFWVEYDTQSQLVAFKPSDCSMG